MTDIKTPKLKDTSLINEICDLGDITIDKKRRWSIEFDDYGIQGVIDIIREHFIESDEAREYWRGQDCDIQQRAVQLAVLVERTRFIEQACDSIRKKNDPTMGHEYAEGLLDAEQAIRDRFNAASD